MIFVDLEEALGQSDAAEANLRRLENGWAEMKLLLRQDIAFADGGTAEQHSGLSRVYRAIVKALSSIRSCTSEAVLRRLDAICQTQLHFWPGG